MKLRAWGYEILSQEESDEFKILEELESGAVKDRFLDDDAATEAAQYLLSDAKG